jgi:hypothetical protein
MYTLTLGVQSAELDIGIIAACLPCLKPIFIRIFGSSGPSRSSNTVNNYKIRTYGGRIGPGTRQNRSFVTTQIGARVGNTREGVGNDSQGSILARLNMPARAITKTTVVSIDRSNFDGRTERPSWWKESDIEAEHWVEEWS